MTLALQIARLFRKKPVNNGNGLPGSCLKQDSIGIGVTKSTNPPMVIGYLTAFTFATFLAPSTLPAVLFISCTTSLLTGKATGSMMKRQSRLIFIQIIQQSCANLNL